MHLHPGQTRGAPPPRVALASALSAPLTHCPLLGLTRLLDSASPERACLNSEVGTRSPNLFESFDHFRNEYIGKKLYNLQAESNKLMDQNQRHNQERHQQQRQYQSQGSSRGAHGGYQTARHANQRGRGPVDVQLAPSQGYSHGSSYLNQMPGNESHLRHAQNSQGGTYRQDEGQQHQPSSQKAHGFSPTRNISRKERETQHVAGPRMAQRHQHSNQRGARQGQYHKRGGRDSFVSHGKAGPASPSKALGSQRQRAAEQDQEGARVYRQKVKTQTQSQQAQPSTQNTTTQADLPAISSKSSSMCKQSIDKGVQTTSAVLKKDQAEQAALGDGSTYQGDNLEGEGVELHSGVSKKAGSRKDPHLAMDAGNEYSMDKRGARAHYGARGGRHHDDRFENVAYQRSHARHSLPQGYHHNKSREVRHPHPSRRDRVDFYHQEHFEDQIQEDHFAFEEQVGHHRAEAGRLAEYDKYGQSASYKKHNANRAGGPARSNASESGADSENECSIGSVFQARGKTAQKAPQDPPKMYQVHQRTRGTRRGAALPYQGVSSAGHGRGRQSMPMSAVDGGSGGGTGEGFSIKLRETEYIGDTTDYSGQSSENDEAARYRPGAHHVRQDNRYGYQGSPRDRQSDDISSEPHAYRQPHRDWQYDRYQGTYPAKNYGQAPRDHQRPQYVSVNERPFTKSNRGDRPSAPTGASGGMARGHGHGQRHRRAPSPGEDAFESDDQRSADEAHRRSSKATPKEDNEQIYEAYDFTPLTKQSRVLRRGRGRRVQEEYSEEEMLSMSAPERRPQSQVDSESASSHHDQESDMDDSELGCIIPRQKHAKQDYQNESCAGNAKKEPGSSHKILQRSGGRGQRQQVTSNSHQWNPEDEFHSSSQQTDYGGEYPRGYQNQIELNQQRRYEANRHRPYYSRSGKHNQPVYRPEINYERDSADKFEDAAVDKRQEQYFGQKKARMAQQAQRERTEKYDRVQFEQHASSNQFGYYEKDYDCRESEKFKYGHYERPAYEQDREDDYFYHQQQKKAYAPQYHKTDRASRESGRPLEHRPPANRKHDKPQGKTRSSAAHHSGRDGYDHDYSYNRVEHAHRGQPGAQSTKLRNSKYYVQHEEDMNYSHHNETVQSEEAAEDGSSSSESHYTPRKGPNHIKFRAKQPSERPVLGKNSSTHDGSDGGRNPGGASSQSPQPIDVYTPKAEKKSSNSAIKILRGYTGFEEPQFYQGSQWRFVRQSTNQNSKQKHYDKGDYDQVQYYFPNADVEENNTDGEQKIYPPIDDYSDEDVGVSPSSLNLRAKVSFGKSATDASGDVKDPVPPSLDATGKTTINIMQNQVELQKTSAKLKKPAVQGKAFSQDSDEQDCFNAKDNKQRSPEDLLGEHPITFDFAKQFFLQEKEESAKTDGQSGPSSQFYERYMEDKDAIEKSLKSGKLWQGTIRMSAKYKGRAFVSVPELDIDVQVEGIRQMNRALDGDTVIVELLPIYQWLEHDRQAGRLNLQAAQEDGHDDASKQTFNPTDGQKYFDQLQSITNYTNETAIEKRVIDFKQEKPDAERQPEFQSNTQAPMSGLANDARKKSDYGKNCKLKAKKFLETTDDEHNEGYIASNSDNNADLAKEERQKRERTTQAAAASGLDMKIKQQSEADNQENCSERLSDSSSERKEDETAANGSEQAKGAETSGEQATAAPQLELEEDHASAEANSPPKFPALSVQKLASYYKEELMGSKQEIISQINAYGAVLRPLGKVVALQMSPVREQSQIATLIELFVSTNQNGGNNESTLLNKDENCIYAQPINKKLPLFQVEEMPPELLKDRGIGRQLSHRYYIMKYKDWKTNWRRPMCQITESIGEAGNLKAETLRILINNEICVDEYEPHADQTDSKDAATNRKNDHIFESLKVFTKDVDPEAQEWIIPQEEIDKRLDLRKKRIFSIDPVTAKDLDDALSIEMITDTVYEVGVHIADVSYFVKQGTDLDQEALRRSTSTYLVHKVYPMLPHILCEQLCSLNPKVDRLAYSIFFRLDLKTGQLAPERAPEIKRSVIRSCAKWNYDLVQKIIDDKLTSEDQLEDEMKPADGHRFLDLAQDVLRLHQLAQARRKQRLSSGSLVFEKDDYNFVLNEETQYPIMYKESPPMQSKELVEEYMLTANVLAAEFLFKHCQDKTLLRAHADIPEHKKASMRQLLDAVGLQQVNLTDSAALAQSLELVKEQASSEIELKDKLAVIQRHMFHNLNIAQYVCVGNLHAEDYRHYGLNFDLYTHFTSPIRRYADLLVHRLITICLREGEDAREKLDGLDYSEYADEVSAKSYNARKASRECVHLFHCLLLKQNGPRVFDALIYDLEQSVIKIFVAELNMDLVVQLRDDVRVDQTTFFENIMEVACQFRAPLALAQGLRAYTGEQELNKTRKQRKKEQQVMQLEQEYLDQQRKLQVSEGGEYNRNTTQTAEQKDGAAGATDDSALLSDSCVFRVFDRVKVKLEATDTYPLDITCQMLITEEDMEVYRQTLAQQEEKQAEMSKMVQFINDGTKNT